MVVKKMKYRCYSCRKVISEKETVMCVCDAYPAGLNRGMVSLVPICSKCAKGYDGR